MAGGLDNSASAQTPDDIVIEPQIGPTPLPPISPQDSSSPDLERGSVDLPVSIPRRTSFRSPFQFKPRFSPFKRESYPQTKKELWHAIISYVSMKSFDTGPHPGSIAEIFNSIPIKPLSVDTHAGHIPGENTVTSDEVIGALSSIRALHIPRGHQRLSSGLLGHMDYANFRSQYLRTHTLIRFLPRGIIPFNYWIPDIAVIDDEFGEPVKSLSLEACPCGRDSIDTAVFARVFVPQGDIQILPALPASSRAINWPLEYYVTSLLRGGKGLSDPSTAAFYLNALERAISWIDRSNGVTEAAEFQNSMASFHEGYHATSHTSLLQLLNSNDIEEFGELIPALRLPIRFAKMIEFLCDKYPDLFASAPTVAISLINQGVEGLSKRDSVSFAEDIKVAITKNQCTTGIFSKVYTLSARESTIGRLCRALQYSSLIVGFTHTEAVPLHNHDTIYPSGFTGYLMVPDRFEKLQHQDPMTVALFTLQHLRSGGLLAVRLGYRFLSRELVGSRLDGHSLDALYMSRTTVDGWRQVMMTEQQKKETRQQQKRTERQMRMDILLKNFLCNQIASLAQSAAFTDEGIPTTSRQFLWIGTVAYVRAKLAVALIIIAASIPLALYFWLSIAYAAVDTFSNYASLALLLTGAILGVGPSVYRKDWAYHDFIRFRMPARNLSELGKRGAEYFFKRQSEGTPISGRYASPYPTESSEGTGLVADVPTQLSSMHDLGPPELGATNLGAYIIWWPRTREAGSNGTVIFARYTPGVVSQMIRGKLPSINEVSSVAHKAASNFHHDIYFG